jgi:hypothetical protein
VLAHCRSNTEKQRRRSLGILDEQTPSSGVSDQCQICTIVQATSASALRLCASACAHIRAEWQYINVRRLFMMIEKSIDVGTQWVVFEPNDEPGPDPGVGDDAGRHRQWPAHVRGRSPARHASEVRDLLDPTSLGDSSGDFGECSCHRRSSLRLPPLDFRAQSLVTMIDERANRLRVRDREDELHLTPTEGFDLSNGGRHPRFRDPPRRPGRVPRRAVSRRP